MANLVRAAGLDIVAEKTVRVPRPHPALFFSLGIVEHLKEHRARHKWSVLAVGCSLSSVHQRNLENFLSVRVYDRTMTILQIFTKRARSREGCLQVQLAGLNYERSRLARAWKHLERQRGGSGFLAGPGERQIELDRRSIDQKIAKHLRALETIRRTRALHRKSRQKAKLPSIVLAGYTNAGKSTLFQCLTGASPLIQNMPFATLDPLTRSVKLPSGKRVSLTDTVGFVEELPSELLSAFRATLEDIQFADIILIVRDASDPKAEIRNKDVHRTIQFLCKNTKTEIPRNRILEVWNKIDIAPLHGAMESAEFCVSAKTGNNCDFLLYRLDKILNCFPFEEKTFSARVPWQCSTARSFLFENGRDLHEHSTPSGWKIRVRLDDQTVQKYQQKFGLRLQTTNLEPPRKSR